MQAKDVMTNGVVTVSPDMGVCEVAKLLLDRRISAVPVVDEQGRMVGIVSEADLMHRPESGTESASSLWHSVTESREEVATRFLKEHGSRAGDVMTREVITATEDAALSDIAALLEEQHIKRVPILRDGKPVGIVSRADLLRGLLSARPSPPLEENMDKLRQAVIRAVRSAGVGDEFLNFVLEGRVVHIWGAVDSVAEQRALRVAAETTPGIEGVADHTCVLSSNVRAMLWG